VLTEIVLTQAVKSAIGYGFSQVVKAVFANTEGLTDREILDKLVFALRQHGAQIGDLDVRLTRLEALVEGAARNRPMLRSSTESTLIGSAAGSGVYCRSCGATPGEASGCPPFPNSSHSWVAFKDVYCRSCGTVPGQATKCPPFPNSSHSWVARRDVYCRSCGTIPGEPTKCPPFPNSSHSWITRRDVYCRSCGAVPGEATACHPYRNSSHSWSSR
jgi:hypothetical protein